jgi:hypothetical protein
MSEIPADILKAAEDALKRVRWSRESADFSSVRDAVAAAILAERERCAKIAEAFDHGVYAALAIRGEA